MKDDASVKIVYLDREISGDHVVLFSSSLPFVYTKNLFLEYMAGNINNINFSEYCFNIERELVQSISVDDEEIYKKS